MSSGARRLNYTNRQRIKREHAVITVDAARPGEPPTFSAKLNLSAYSLPPMAVVIIEAHRHTAYQRFDFGSVAALRPPEDLALRDFGAGEGVRFRAKVVDAGATAGTAARILAQADDITPDQQGRRQSLLALDPDPNMREEVWRLDIDDSDGPIVKVSSHLVRDRHALARSRQFITIAMPEILRRTLSWAVADVPDSEDEWQTPRGRWIRLACGVLGRAEPPDDMDDADGRDRFVESTVKEFCKRHGIARTFGGWWAEGGTV